MEEERIYNRACSSHLLSFMCILTGSSVGIFYLVGLFDMWAGLRTLFISAGGAYLISAKINSPYMPWIGFVFLMGHMSVNHIYRQSLNDPATIDITGPSKLIFPYGDIETDHLQALKWL